MHTMSQRSFDKMLDLLTAHLPAHAADFDSYGLDCCDQLACTRQRLLLNSQNVPGLEPDQRKLALVQSRYFCKGAGGPPDPPIVEQGDEALLPHGLEQLASLLVQRMRG